LKNIAILGSSGSIGKNALWVISRFPEELRVFGLSVNSDLETLINQIENYKPNIVCVADTDAANKLSSELKGNKPDILIGQDGLESLASHPEIDIVVNAVVGFAGLRSTLAAAKAGKRIALANKESMVAGGELVNKFVNDNDAEIIPVDSEHSAIFQCLRAGNEREVNRLILTSSGGPFRTVSKEQFPGITLEQALNHPTWNMGPKITIDSATLMNKTLEVIEAYYLFSLPAAKIDVVIHPQSVVHSMVEFIDGSTIAQLSKPDMRVPIQYALFYPERRKLDTANLDLSNSLNLTFEPPDFEKFPSLSLAYKALEIGGTAPAVLNASNEKAVEFFLNRKIKFVDIFSVVSLSLEKYQYSNIDSIESVIDADKFGRDIAIEYITNE